MQVRKFKFDEKLSLNKTSLRLFFLLGTENKQTLLIMPNEIL